DGPAGGVRGCTGSLQGPDEGRALILPHRSSRASFTSFGLHSSPFTQTGWQPAAGKGFRGASVMLSMKHRLQAATVPAPQLHVSADLAPDGALPAGWRRLRRPQQRRGLRSFGGGWHVVTAARAVYAGPVTGLSFQVLLLAAL